MSVNVGTISTWQMVRLPGETDEAITDSCDVIMDGLLDIEEAEGRVHSAAVSLDLVEMTLEVDLGVMSVESIDEAIEIADEAIKRAMTAAGHRLLDAPRVRKDARILEPA